MEKTKLLDPLGQPLLIGIVPRPCPTCAYAEVMGMMLEDGPEFVAWCPCGTLYDDEGLLRTNKCESIKEWWKE